MCFYYCHHFSVVGFPVVPSQIVLQIDEDQLYISWESYPSILLPVVKFVVTIQTTPTEDHHILTRRQLPASADGYFEYETSETSLTVEVNNSSQSYTVTICAVNHLGRECSPPVQIDPEQIESFDPEQIDPGDIDAVETVMIPKHEGFGKKVSSSKLNLAAAVVVPGMLLVLCISVVIVIIICKCSTTRKEYCPAKQGIVMVYI